MNRCSLYWKRLKGMEKSLLPTLGSAEFHLPNQSRLTHEKGPDEKLICVPVSDPIWSQRDDISELNPHRLKEIEHFFQVYKDLEEKKVVTGGWGDVNEAIQIYQECVKRYENSDHKKKRTFTI